MRHSTNTQCHYWYRDTNAVRSLVSDPPGFPAASALGRNQASRLKKGAFPIGLKPICQSSEDSQSSTSTRLR